MSKRLVLMLLLFLLFSCEEILKSGGKKKFSDPAPVAQEEPAEIPVPVPVDPEPKTSKLDSNCLTSSDYDTCIFKKNLFAQTKLIQDSGGIQNVSNQNIYGVKLDGLGASGTLSNSSLKIYKAESEAQTDIGSVNLKVDVQTDSSLVAQLMTYYWMNQVNTFLSQQTGSNFLQDKQIKVITETNLKGFVPGKNTLYLNSETGNSPFALNGDTSVYYTGLLQAIFANNQKLMSVSTNKYRSCGGHHYGCCVQATGCSQAIASAFGDYLVRVFFPDSTSLAESWANSEAGAQICGVSRHAQTAESMTAQQVFQICESESKAGEVYTMGWVLADIMWQLRQSAKTRAGESERQIDMIFVEALKSLDGNDDFATFKGKLISADSALFGGRFASDLNQLFSQKGL